MISLITSFLVLFVGYFIYSKLAEKIFAPDDRKTPALLVNDGVDCVPMKTWKAFLVQLLNIAGTGPIFGALMGAVFGPIVFLWIVLGSILGGAVHDYMSGMISCRNKGESVAEISGRYFGKVVKYLMRVFTVTLLLLMGTVFVTSPASLLASLTPASLNPSFWIVVIFLYYLTATLLPIDKIIGKLYPLFGILLVVMALGILFAMIFSKDITIPEITFQNMNPDNLPTWPFMFVTVACGAISGFHATQSPMVAKCIIKEKNGTAVFYGAMITEAVIALIWAAAGVAFYGTTEVLNEALMKYGQSDVVYEIARGLLGTVGGILAIVGVIVCPITSGDTAFRGARLILAEWFSLSQKKIRNRLFLTLPLFAISAVLTQLDFDVLWRYFSWSNQTLAMVTLWVCTAYLLKEGKKTVYSLITAFPATFMSAVSMTYILTAPEGFSLPTIISCLVGILFAIGCFIVYIIALVKNSKQIL